MHRAVIIYLISIACIGSVTPLYFEKDAKQLQAPAPVENNNSQFATYPYPTYPEYPSNGYAAQPENKESPVPVQQMPTQQILVQQTPVQQVPAQQMPVQQTLVQQMPAQQTPVQQTPVQQTLVQQMPAQQTPVQQTPVQQTSVQQISESPSIISSLKSFISSLILYVSHSSYLLQILMIALFSTSSVSLICTYTPICTNLLENSEVTNFARAYTRYYMDDITNVFARATDNGYD